MDSMHYTKSEAGWQLHKNGKAVGAPFATMAVAYSQPSTPEFLFKLLIHGDAKLVTQWKEARATELAGKDQWGEREAKELHMTTGDFSVEEVNRSLTEPGYVERMLEKHNGTLQVSPMDKDSERDFFVAVELLQEVQANFEHGLLLSPVQHGAQRERQLGLALLALASGHGVKLQTPLSIDSRGEFSIVAENKDHGLANPNQGCGPYGVEFTKILNAHNPRVGTSPTSFLCKENGWCRMNHFDVEKMILDQYELRQANRPAEPHFERDAQRA